MIKRGVKNGERRLNAPRLAGMILSVVLCLGLVIWGLVEAFAVLERLWQEQGRVTDRELDVVITSGKMVRPDAISYHFGLTNGANLATIPFEERRAKLLKSVPSIRDIHIERRLPNRVTIDVIERKPIARITSRKGSPASGRVADTEGVVFVHNSYASNTSLPLVREPTEDLTMPGGKLTGLTAAALRLVEAAAQPDLAELRILEIDTSHTDYLDVTLANLDHAQIAWDHMKEDTKGARQSLQRQLRHLNFAIATHLASPGTVWLATDWGSDSRITASGARNRIGN